ncbi:MAG: hypothetical protein QME81_14925 [bacterium]|nr:hypothetical protein [bacterium]
MRRYENTIMVSIRDEFLSEEDLGLRDLPEDELLAYWDMWLEQAQITNDIDEDTYSHGVFTELRFATQTASEICCHHPGK